MILHEFHLLDAHGAARLLKTLEEPPASTVFIVLADQVPQELVTIASRCVRIDFSAIQPDVIEAMLVADGVDPAARPSAAASANGDLDRARVLASDPGLRARRDAFAGFPDRLDGTGRTVVALGAEIMRADRRLRRPRSPRSRRRARRARGTRRRPEANAAADASSCRTGTSASCAGTAPTSCAAAWRSWPACTATRWSPAPCPVPTRLPPAVQRIHAALESLERNPNETLLLQALLIDLPSLG